ncbi:MAG: toprim domain-containing protein [Vampirovibrionales bacterium]
MSHYENAPQYEGLALALQLKKIKKGYIGQCPLCGYKNAFSLDCKENKILFYCHACQDDPRKFLTHFQSIGLWSKNKSASVAIAKPAKVAKVSDEDLQKKENARKVWEASSPICGTLAERYLNSRGIHLGNIETLRFIPSCKHSQSGFSFPAMIAKVTTRHGDFMGIHRTYLAHDGMAKADVDSPKMMLGNIKGGSVHLSPLTGDTLAVCEGIETGLSILQMTGIPTWAGLSTAGMVNLSLPLTLKTLVICIDHDEAGIKASHTLQRRAIEQGITVKRLMPPNVGTDFNDFIKEMF